MPDNSRKPAEMVDEFIQSNFDTNVVEVTDFPLFPYGKRIKDRFGAEMVVYYDFFANAVNLAYPDRR